MKQRTHVCEHIFNRCADARLCLLREFPPAAQIVSPPRVDAILPVVLCSDDVVQLLVVLCSDDVVQVLAVCLFLLLLRLGPIAANCLEGVFQALVPVSLWGRNIFRRAHQTKSLSSRALWHGAITALAITGRNNTAA